MQDNLKRLKRRSIRYKGYDYTQPGAYFITMVTQGRKCVFGEVNTNKEVYLSSLGKIVEECWQCLPIHFQNIDIFPFIVMPNHIHGIITIFEDCRGTIYRAPTNVNINIEMIGQLSTSENFSKPVPGSIPTIVRTFKAAVSRFAKRRYGLENIWQRNYFEHIIRNENEFNATSNYILANPFNWVDDPEYLKQ